MHVYLDFAGARKQKMERNKNKNMRRDPVRDWDLGSLGSVMEHIHPSPLILQPRGRPRLAKRAQTGNTKVLVAAMWLEVPDATCRSDLPKRTVNIASISRML